MTNQTMRAVLIDGYDGIEALRVGDIPVPVPAKGQILVKVAAAGLNPADIAVASGVMQAMFPLSLPAVVGGELSGTVVETAEGETEWKVGDEVHALIGISGAYAEYALVPSRRAVRKPSGMSFTEAAALPTAVAAANAALDKAKVGAGTRLVVHAAAGGVGSILVQLAKARGAHVTGLASPENMAFVKALGADGVVDRTGTDVANIKNVDVVIDGFGPAAQDVSWHMLKSGGHLISLVNPPSAEKASEHSVTVAKVLGDMDPEHLVNADVLYKQGKLKPFVMKSYSMDDVVEAFRRLSARKTQGKITLKM